MHSWNPVEQRRDAVYLSPKLLAHLADVLADDGGHGGRGVPLHLRIQTSTMRHKLKPSSVTDPSPPCWKAPRGTVDERNEHLREVAQRAQQLRAQREHHLAAVAHGMHVPQHLQPMRHLPGIGLAQSLEPLSALTAGQPAGCMDTPASPLIERG